MAFLERESRLELRHLRYFIRAAELSNFTKAAESLYISQPTLSVQIHQLEEELGTELFARVGRNVRLTESGKIFQARALQAVRAIEEGSREIDALKGLLRGQLCLAALPLYGSRLLTGWISKFSVDHPLLLTTVMALPSEDMEMGIIDGKIDLGVSFLPATHSELSSVELFHDEIVVVVAKNHELTRKKTLKIEDLVNLPMALPTTRISATRMLGKYFEEHGIQPKIGVNFDDGHALIEFVKMGTFATLLPRLGVGDDSGVALFPLPGNGIMVTTGAIYTNLSPASQVFLDLIVAESKTLTG